MARMKRNGRRNFFVFAMFTTLYFFLYAIMTYGNGFDEVVLQETTLSNQQGVVHDLNKLNQELFNEYQFHVNKSGLILEALKQVQTKLSRVRSMENIFNTNKTSTDDQIYTMKITCKNIHQIKGLTELSAGVTKTTFKGDFRGTPVVVKMVSNGNTDVKTCLEDIPSDETGNMALKSRCYVFPTRKLMKEILLAQQLQHPGIAQLLGYCIRNENDETGTTDLTKRGIMSVFERATDDVTYQYMDQLTTWKERITHVIEVSKLLDYLENSPLGSLIIRDHKLKHFLVFNKTLKMIDLDDMDNLEPTCIESNGGADCKYSLKCIEGTCRGFNAKENLYNLYQNLFQELMQSSLYPIEVDQQLQSLKWDISKLKINAKELVSLLEKIISSY